MGFFEEKIGGRRVFDGKVFSVDVDTVRLSDGEIRPREVVVHRGGVGIVPVTGTGEVLMVRQFRYPFGRMMLEAPAGKLDGREDPYLAAVRELSEETGFTADEMVYMGSCCTSPGFSTEVLHIYLALGLHAGEKHPDEDEFLNVEKISLKELSRMVMADEIDDGKTIVAILKAEKYLQNR